MADQDSGSQSILWVSLDGHKHATGTADDPFNSISQALRASDPGTVIKVMGGEYTETVLINSSMSGTADHPVTIEAADGPGSVTLTGQNIYQSTILIEGASNITIRDMTIVGVGSTEARDDAPIKATIKDGISPTNIVIESNTLMGTGRDAIKLAMADNVTIIDNHFDGSFGQELIDLYSTRGATIAGNVFDGSANYSAICAKSGTTGVDIDGNVFNGDYGYTIKLGGQVFNDPNHPTILAALERNPDSLQADHINITNNIMLAQSETDVKVLGATDVLIAGNYFGSTSQFGDHNPNVPSILINDMGLGTFRESFVANVTVESNVSTRAAVLLDRTDGVTADNDNSSLFGTASGDQPLLDSIDRLYHSVAGHLSDDPTQLAVAKLYQPPTDVLDQPGPIEDVRDPLPTPTASSQIADAIANSECGLCEVASTRLADHIVDFLGADVEVVDIQAMLASARHIAEDNAILGPSDGVAVTFADSGSDFVRGSDGVDILIGAHRSVLHGDDGDDILYGGSGNDYLSGGRGDDLIIFGAGNDQAIGKQGSDTFYYDEFSETGRIKDFTIGEDRLIIDSVRYATVEDLLSHATERNGHVRFGFPDGKFLLIENTDIASLAHADIVVHLVA